MRCLWNIITYYYSFKRLDSICGLFKYITSPVYIIELFMRKSCEITITGITNPKRRPEEGIIDKIDHVYLF